MCHGIAIPYLVKKSYPIDCSLPGSSVHGILQAIILKWVAISFSRGSSWRKDWTHISCIAGRVFTNFMLSHFSHFWLGATLWTIAYQALLSMALSGQEYWTGLPCCPPGDLSDPGTEPVSPMSPALAGGFFTTGTNMGSPIEPQGSPKLSVEFLNYPLPPFFFHCKKALQYFMPKLGLLWRLSCRLVEK